MLSWKHQNLIESWVRDERARLTQRIEMFDRLLERLTELKYAKGHPDYREWANKLVTMANDTRVANGGEDRVNLPDDFGILSELATGVDPAKTDIRFTAMEDKDAGQ